MTTRCCLPGFTPRRWLEDGNRIEVRRAPTRFGDLSMTVRSRAAPDRLRRKSKCRSRIRPSALLVRLRHPAGARMRSVQVNGRKWTDFDPAKEWVRMRTPGEARYMIVTNY